MQTIGIYTTQHVAIDFQLASIGERILAFAIDAVIMVAYSFLILYGFIQLKLFSMWAYYGLVLFPWVFYDLICEVFFNGQSIGKRARNLRIISLDGSQPSLSQYLLRWFIRPIDVAFWGALAILSIIMTGKGQRLGDLAAGTCVINLSPQVGIQQAKLPEIAEDYAAQYPNVTQLTDRDIQLIRQIVQAYERSRNRRALDIMAEKVAKTLGLEDRPPALKFLKRIVKDYQHLTSE